MKTLVYSNDMNESDNFVMLMSMYGLSPDVYSNEFVGEYTDDDNSYTLGVYFDEKHDKYLVDLTTMTPQGLSFTSSSTFITADELIKLLSEDI